MSQMAIVKIAKAKADADPAQVDNLTEKRWK